MRFACAVVKYSSPTYQLVGSIIAKCFAPPIYKRGDLCYTTPEPKIAQMEQEKI